MAILYHLHHPLTGSCSIRNVALYRHHRNCIYPSNGCGGPGHVPSRLRAVSLSLWVIMQHLLGRAWRPPVIGMLSDTYGLESAIKSDLRLPFWVRSRAKTQVIVQFTEKPILYSTQIGR